MPNHTGPSHGNFETVDLDRHGTASRLCTGTVALTLLLFPRLRLLLLLLFLVACSVVGSSSKPRSWNPRENSRSCGACLSCVARFREFRRESDEGRGRGWLQGVERALLRPWFMISLDWNSEEPNLGERACSFFGVSLNFIAFPRQ